MKTMKDVIVAGDAAKARLDFSWHLVADTSLFSMAGYPDSFSIEVMNFIPKLAVVGHATVVDDRIDDDAFAKFVALLDAFVVNSEKAA